MKKKREEGAQTHTYISESGDLLRHARTNTQISEPFGDRAHKSGRRHPEHCQLIPIVTADMSRRSRTPGFVKTNRSPYRPLVKSAQVLRQSCLDFLAKADFAPSMTFGDDDEFQATVDECFDIEQVASVSSEVTHWARFPNETRRKTSVVIILRYGMIASRIRELFARDHPDVFPTTRQIASILAEQSPFSVCRIEHLLSFNETMTHRAMFNNMPLLLRLPTIREEHLKKFGSSLPNVVAELQHEDAPSLATLDQNVVAAVRHKLSVQITPDAIYDPEC